jgi:hypothetical protein
MKHISKNFFIKSCLQTGFALLLFLTACKNNKYDGLQNIDPVPEGAITFPDAIGANGAPQLDDNAFIINQNSVANGNIVLRIQVPQGKQIDSISVIGQRFRGSQIVPNISPTVPGATSRAPSGFGRTSSFNLPKIASEKSNTATYTIPAASLPAALSSAGLGTSLKPPTAALPAVPPSTPATPPFFDVVRFYVLLKFTDGTQALSAEVRIVVRG